MSEYLELFWKCLGLVIALDYLRLLFWTLPRLERESAAMTESYIEAVQEIDKANRAFDDARPKVDYDQDLFDLCQEKSA